MRLLFLAAVLAVTNPASLQDGVRAALRSAKSFVVTVKINRSAIVPLGASIEWTVVAPNRYRQVTHGDPSGDETTVIIGHEVYGNKHGAWDVQTWDDRLVSGFEGDVFDVHVVSIGPDRSQGGKTLGTFVMNATVGPSGGTLTCTYDKQTFRPLICGNDAQTVTYGRYDDPSVTIPTPAHAKRVDQ
jgi:hypothetical protein